MILTFLLFSFPLKGWAYQEGALFDEDSTLARRYGEKAAALGSESAMYNLGLLAEDDDVRRCHMST